MYPIIQAEFQKILFKNKKKKQLLRIRRILNF